MGEPTSINSQRWTGTFGPGWFGQSSRPPSPIILSIFLFGSGCIVGWLPHQLLNHLVWKQLGSPIFFDDLNVPEMAITIVAGVVAAVLCRRSGRLQAAFAAGFVAMLASALTHCVQLKQAVDHPAATITRAYFVTQSWGPVYIGSRANSAHWEWEWQVLNPLGRRERINLADELGAQAKPGDSCVIARVDADAPVRLVRSMRLLSAGDGTGSWLNAHDNMTRCFAIK